MCLLFFLFHLGVIVPIFIAFVTGTSDYPCDEEALVKAAIYTTLGLNLVAMVHDGMIVFVGWRGGPLECHRRRHASSLVGARVLLYFLTFAALIFSTTLIYLPSIQKSCYAGNPCKSKDVQLWEDFCVDGFLTPPCALVFSTPLETIVECRTYWFDLAASFAVDKYDPLTVPHYSGAQYSRANDSSLCQIRYDANSKAFVEWQQETGQFFPPYNPMISPSDEDVDIAALGQVWSQEMGYTGLTSPWDVCLEGRGECSSLLLAVNECPKYNDLLFYGQTSSDYSYALAAVWASWGILLVNLLIIVLAFNAFPDYNNKDSWQESVKTIARLMCCSSILKHARTEDGQDASAGLGDLLFKLFGGIDLVTDDLILGLYLVSERQSWRRFLYAKGRIEKLGQRLFVPRKALPKAGAEAKNDQASEDVEFDSREDSNALSFRNSVLHTKNDEAGQSGKSESGSSRSAGPQRMARVVVTHDRRPFLTPFDFSPVGTFEPKVDAREAVSMYVQASDDRSPLSASSASLQLVRECVDLVYFAKAAYGLQQKKWKDATHDNLASALGDRCLACTPCLVGSSAKRHHFTKRNFASILRYTKVAPSDVLHVSYANTALGVIPYLVVLDRRSNHVVISMRGTAHMADVVTDLLGHPKECAELMPEWVQRGNMDNSPLEIHSGILSSALAVLRDLEENGILDALETNVEMPAPVDPWDDIVQDTAAIDHAISELDLDDEVDLPIERAKSILLECGRRDIPLVLTGHSLGAAVASVVALKLRSRFSCLRCVCFNPPGGVMSGALSRMSEEFCTSFIVGSDIISRLNLQNMIRLIDDMVLALACCRKPKLTILLEILFGRRKFSSNTDTYYAADAISPPVLEVLQHYIDTSTLHADSIRDGDCNLLPPGKAMFLRPVEKLPDIDGGHVGNEDVWDVVPIDKEQLMSEGILMNQKALDHHHRTYRKSNPDPCALMSTLTRACTLKRQCGARSRRCCRASGTKAKEVAMKDS